MKPNSVSLATTALLCLSYVGPAAALTTTNAAGVNAAASASRDDAKVKKKQAETDFKVVKAQCKEMTGVEAKICQRDAKIAYHKVRDEIEMARIKSDTEKAVALQNDNAKRQAASSQKPAKQ